MNGDSLDHWGHTGSTQALIYGFAKGGLGISDLTCFEIWREGLAVIASRLPRVGEADNPGDVYVAPYPDSGADLLGDIDTAFVAATVAGLAHPGREQKRRSLLGIQVLISESASVAIAPLGSALSSLSDPATLTWLLRVIEMAGENAAPIIARSRSVLIKLTKRPHLTVRALARRIISRDNVLCVILTSQILNFLIVISQVHCFSRRLKVLRRLLHQLTGLLIW